MDLSKFNMEVIAERGATLELETPTGEPLLQDDGETPVTITLLGQDSKVWRNKNREFSNKRIQDMAKKRSRKMDYMVSDEDAAEMMAACTVSWDGIVDDGEEIECTQKNAYELYLKYAWIREQCDVFIGDRANFLPTV